MNYGDLLDTESKSPLLAPDHFMNSFAKNSDFGLLKNFHSKEISVIHEDKESQTNRDYYLMPLSKLYIHSMTFREWS